MEKLMVECLRCGARRTAAPLLLRHDAGECPRCTYVGWAPAGDLNESVRRTLRERPPERRRLRVA